MHEKFWVASSIIQFIFLDIIYSLKSQYAYVSDKDISSK